MKPKEFRIHIEKHRKTDHYFFKFTLKCNIVFFFVEWSYENKYFKIRY